MLRELTGLLALSLALPAAAGSGYRGGLPVQFS